VGPRAGVDAVAPAPFRELNPGRPVRSLVCILTGWTGLDWTGLDAMAKRKIPCSCRESNHDRPAHSLVTIPTELPESC
jgi:hypothetical protein